MRRKRLSLPVGARAARFELGDDELVVVSLPASKPALPASLTPAEREVARAILDGRSNEEIARARGTSARTVANQVAAILRKAGVASRTELALKVRAR